jgi:hypothetical protein
LAKASALSVPHPKEGVKRSCFDHFVTTAKGSSILVIPTLEIKKLSSPNFATLQTLGENNI